MEIKHSLADNITYSFLTYFRCAKSSTKPQTRLLFTTILCLPNFMNTLIESIIFQIKNRTGVHLRSALNSFLWSKVWLFYTKLFSRSVPQVQCIFRRWSAVTSYLHAHGSPDTQHLRAAPSYDSFILSSLTLRWSESTEKPLLGLHLRNHSMKLTVSIRRFQGDETCHIATTTVRNHRCTFDYQRFINMLLIIELTYPNNT